MGHVLGGKGANLAEMCALGVPVPPGFTLPTALCARYRDAGGALDANVQGAIAEGLAFIEEDMQGPRFGDPAEPLLVSVRSGAQQSMPGMMDTVLNVGLTDATVEGLASVSGNRRFALDSYRRLIQMYGDVVCGVKREVLEEPLRSLKAEQGIALDRDLTEAHLEGLITELQSIFAAEVGEAFPQDPHEQLRQAVAAVFGSWQTKRAVVYRRLNKIPDEWGTAANIQAMVFGNYGADSASGVAFSRNPSSGVKPVLGEWLPNAQGEDVVAGIRTPGPVDKVSASGGESEVGALEDELPETYRSLLEVMARLETHFRDIQDIEFTVQAGTLYLLQTRSAKRTAASALRTAVEMVEEGLITRQEALRRVTPEQIDQLLHPQLDPEAPKTLLATGLPASPGAASGKVVISADQAEKLAEQGQELILVRHETSPEDIHGMHAAKGILTATGGMTSHAAVVARGMGRPCVAGCQGVNIVEKAGRILVQNGEQEYMLREGDEITIDGGTGAVYLGRVPTVQAELSNHFATFMGWADEQRALGVRANADTPRDAAVAVRLGAEGIGLCRTEHMFFAPDRIRAMRQMILSESEDDRRRALDKLGPMQRQDFEEIFQIMGERPVTIRLLDPPLHEFLPQSPEEIGAIAQDMGVSRQALRQKAESLHEFNPMLGHRGCRLSLSYPEIVEMQVRAVLEAACFVASEGGLVQPEIMVPLVMNPEELKRIRARIEEIAEDVFARAGRSVAFLIGTMIELPRAALVADEIAEYADFFSYGTNDLTQTTMGLSRDDSGSFLTGYITHGVVPGDPFASIDRKGVGKLVEMGTELGRRARPALKVGICGEHGGDPSSIAFFAETGLDYVSCSPYRLPVARLAAAWAALEAEAKQ